jgi:hypothetical protein
MILDFAEFKSELYTASRVTLDAIRNDCKAEHLYSFALVTTPLFGYVFPNANTAEGLLEASKQYLADTQDFNGEIEMAMKYGRWEPTAFWRFFGRHDGPFGKVNSMLEAINMENALCMLPETDFRPTITKLEDILFDVLSELRSDGCFEGNLEEIYVNICYQDQDYEDLCRCALRVNSRSVSNRMRNDLSDVLHFWQSKQKDQN